MICQLQVQGCGRLCGKGVLGGKFNSSKSNHQALNMWSLSSYIVALFLFLEEMTARASAGSGKNGFESFVICQLQVQGCGRLCGKGVLGVKSSMSGKNLSPVNQIIES